MTRLLVVLSYLVLGTTIVALGGTATLPLVLSPVVMIMAGLIWRGHGAAPGPSDPDDTGGGGTTPPPPTPPPVPGGGIPLADAEPSSRRLRDHVRPAPRPTRQRRPAREPDRSPVRQRAGATGIPRA